MAASSGRVRSASGMPISTMLTPVCAGRASVTRERTREPAPSAPTSRARSAWPPSAKCSRWPPPGSAVACRNARPHTTVSGGSESSRRSRRSPRSTSGRVSGASSGVSWHSRSVPSGSSSRRSWPSGRATARKAASSPASRNARCPPSRCRSSMPPWPRAAREGSRSWTTASMPWTCRTRAQVRPPRPAPTTAIRGRRGGWKVGLFMGSVPSAFSLGTAAVSIWWLLLYGVSIDLAYRYGLGKGGGR